MWLRWISRAAGHLFPAALFGLAVVEVAIGQIEGPTWAAWATAPLVTLPLYLRDRAPWAMLIVIFATIFGAYLVGLDQDDYAAEIVGGVSAVYFLSARRPPTEAVAGAIVALAALVTTVMRPVDVGSLAWSALVICGPASAGIVLRNRRLLIDRLRATTADLERSRAVAAKAAVAEERTRVARELHDVVAHAVSVMVVQAGAGQRLVGVDDGRARDALVAIGDSGRQALLELRRLLTVLRGDESGELEPQPGLAELDALAERIGRAGLTVTVHREGHPLTLSPGLDLTAYRIVQEALTNVVRHAGASTADVVLRFLGDAVEVQIDDDGTGAEPTLGEVGAGSGLAGMRERAASCGGTVRVGRRADGGFRVVARLPSGAAA
jgi:signal transduction histidine kinase